ncbi:hypothetical protein CA13_24040 [Planctomycetes bacterium CA13]|uniref:Fructosamine kinase n=1 Tax=Novipirellula herctigrandis TaxID=2527986 RepID=A0A5C5Z1Z8_9BACT|nr:hypothetical protein CA13_24040 [Planctomycetes bacterium CA13]
MNQTAAETMLQTMVDPGIRVARVDSVGGGCISDSLRVDLVPESFIARTLFVKTNDLSFADNFSCEFEGLEALAKTETIRIPRPFVTGNANGASWLVIEWMEPSTRSEAFFPKFGRELAKLHQATAAERIGWPRDNYLGAAKQKNGRDAESWSDFVAENRIGFQIRWAVDQGLADAGLRRDCQQILDAMSDLLEGRRAETSLLHGDLWSGNYLCGSEGQPALVDPAVSYGCHEAEFGMIRLFGSCPDSFYDAYQQTWPMRDGWQRRSNVYVLYHLLNHLNLFGSGYLGQCRSVAAEILRAS